MDKAELSSRGSVDVPPTPFTQHPEPMWGASMKRVRVGVGAGFSGDRLDAALPLVERGEIGYLIFECLAERTIALAQRDRLRDSARGYHPFLEERLRRVLAACKAHGVRIVSNMGAA